MHVVFMPYGKRDLVEKFLRELEAQKLTLEMWKGEEKHKIWVDCQLRVLPYGFYEFVFPREHLDKVLTTFNAKEDRYLLGRFKLAFLRKVLKCQPIPKYKENAYLIWTREHVNIITLGIREDGNIIEDHPASPHLGWEHEAI